jgi:hypothetical protein
MTGTAAGRAITRHSARAILLDDAGRLLDGPGRLLLSAGPARFTGPTQPYRLTFPPAEPPAPAGHPAWPANNLSFLASLPDHKDHGN